MELSVKSGNFPARLEVDTSARALVVRGVMGDQRVNLFPDTRIEVVGDRLIVGAREFTPYAVSGRAPTIMDVQEFAKLLRQVAGSPRTSSTTAPGNQQSPQTRDKTVSAKALSHFEIAAQMAAFVQIVGLVGAILAAIGGFVVAFNSDCDRFCDGYSLTERYPFLIEGIAVGVFGAFSMLSIAMVAAYIRGRAAEKGI